MLNSPLLYIFPIGTGIGVAIVFEEFLFFLLTREGHFGMGVGSGPWVRSWKGGDMYRIGLYLGALVLLLVPAGKANAQFNFANLFNGAGQNTSSKLQPSASRPDQKLFAPNNVATPKAVDTSNRRVGGFQFLNTSNATQNLSSVFNQSSGGSQLMGNRVIGYSDFPKEKDMPGVKTLQTYFHYRTYKPGGKN